MLTAAGAQVIFRVNVAPQRVMEGESFQVQYVLEEGDKRDEFFPPDFKGFRVVRGPDINGGTMQGTNGVRRLKNIVFVLETMRPGRYVIPAATATVNGIFVKSDNATIEVLSKAAVMGQLKESQLSAANENYFLRPDEDPYQKMRDNLFIKVAVNKKTCYAGEPVIATYKLYSRLQSKSDIVKNPGFYGFTVQDMINLEDKVLTKEMINGKAFDVHTIRKVQLFPLRAGSFSIDEMEIQNKVTFSKSSVRKKTEQEIEEGVYDHSADPPIAANTVEFESSMHTEPVTIHVKPVPAVSQPADYSGATGNFSITATLEKTTLSKNEEGALLVTISGKGNFTQLSAPVIEWPKDIEGFEAIIKDELDKTRSPLEGKRIFRFPFTISRSGVYTFPAIKFAYFNPDSNHYKTVNTKPVSISIDNNKETTDTVKEKKVIARHTTISIWAIALTTLLVALGVIFFLKKRSKRALVSLPVAEKKILIPADEILQPASLLLPADNKSFYTALRNGIWLFLDQHLALKGSGMNKNALRSAMQQKDIAIQYQDELIEVLGQCETGIFTNVESVADKKELLERTKQTLKHIGEKMETSS